LEENDLGRRFLIDDVEDMVLERDWNWIEIEREWEDCRKCYCCFWVKN
jgi:hypothetical protein